MYTMISISEANYQSWLLLLLVYSVIANRYRATSTNTFTIEAVSVCSMHECNLNVSG